MMPNQLANILPNSQVECILCTNSKTLNRNILDEMTLSYSLKYYCFIMYVVHKMHPTWLGLMPIMGQPMTWLSSGNSHLLAIALPSVLLALLASRRVSYGAQA